MCYNYKLIEENIAEATEGIFQASSKVLCCHPYLSGFEPPNLMTEGLLS